MAVGKQFTMVIKTDGNLWSTGRNYRGQLGDGSLKTSKSFKKVIGMSDVKAVSSNRYVTMAVKTDGR